MFCKLWRWQLWSLNSFAFSFTFTRLWHWKNWDHDRDFDGSRPRPTSKLWTFGHWIHLAIWQIQLCQIHSQALKLINITLNDENWSIQTSILNISAKYHQNLSLYNFELYRFKVCVFFETQCRFTTNSALQSYFANYLPSPTSLTSFGQ